MAIYTEDFAGSAASLTTPWVQWRSSGLSRDLKRDGGGKGAAQAAGTTDNGAFYNNTIGANQYSQVQVGTWTISAGVNYLYLMVRCDLVATPTDIHTSGTYYWFWSDGTSDTALIEVTAGSGAVLDTANGTTFATGDVFKFEIIGSAMKVYKNGAAITWTTSGTTTVTDATIATGFPGVGLAIGDIAADLIDNWEGGDVGRVTKNTRSAPLGSNVGMGFRM